MKDLHIKGVQKSSLIDYPGKISAIVFLSRCNFRCPYCHNPELIFNEQDFPDISEEEFFVFLKKQKKWIDGVCITGGEPALHPGLIDFMKKIKETGLLVKLDTNGTIPQVIEEAVKEKCVDFIAMDIKNSLDRYDETTNSKLNKTIIDNIKSSVDLIMKYGDESMKDKKIDYEFRTTVLPKFHSKEEFEKISNWLKGAKKYTIQQFHVRDDLIDNSLKDEKTFLTNELEEFKKILEKNIKNVEIRN